MYRNKGNNPLKKIISGLILSVLSYKALALPDDNAQIMYMRSDTADISQEKHKGVFKGHVELDQGTTHLRAASAITKGNADNKLVKAIAYGDAKEQAHYWSTTSTEKPPMHAYADTIYYYPEKHLIELVGNAKITQGDNTFTAPKIIYDTEKQHVLTERAGNKRTSITIYPEKKA